eukprot:9693236-Alexandrium_andersonii.AAC.1
MSSRAGARPQEHVARAAGQALRINYPSPAALRRRHGRALPAVRNAAAREVALEHLAGLGLHAANHDRVMQVDDAQEVLPGGFEVTVVVHEVAALSLLPE